MTGTWKRSLRATSLGLPRLRPPTVPFLKKISRRLAFSAFSAILGVCFVKARRWPAAIPRPKVEIASADRFFGFFHYLSGKSLFRRAQAMSTTQKTLRTTTLPSSKNSTRTSAAGIGEHPRPRRGTVQMLSKVKTATVFPLDSARFQPLPLGSGGGGMSRVAFPRDIRTDTPTPAIPRDRHPSTGKPITSSARRYCPARS